MLTTFKPKQAIALKNVKYKWRAVYDALNIAVFDLVEKIQPILLLLPEMILLKDIKNYV